MKNPLSGLFRARDKPRDAVSPAEVFYFGSSVSGKTVNPRNAVQVSTVYACVRVIAETIASLPVSVYEDTGSGSRKATEHPLQRLLHDEPNSEMTSFVWRETILFGNQFTPDDVLDGYPVDRLMHDIALALMAVQTQTTEILSEFPTKAAETQEPKAIPLDNPS